VTGVQTCALPISYGDQEVFSIDELVAAFDWEHCNRADGKFDAKKLLAINYEHLKSPRLVDDRSYAQQVQPRLRARGLDPSPDEVERVVPLVRERATTFVDAADRLDFVYRDPPALDAAAATKFLVKSSAARLRELRAVVERVDPWTAPSLEHAIESWVAGLGVPMKEVAQPARVALTGRSASPGLFDVIAALGRGRALARLSAGADAADRSS